MSLVMIVTIAFAMVGKIVNCDAHGTVLRGRVGLGRLRPHRRKQQRRRQKGGQTGPDGRLEGMKRHGEELTPSFSRMSDAF
jgi:hypothetical protein